MELYAYFWYRTGPDFMQPMYTLGLFLYWASVATSMPRLRCTSSSTLTKKSASQMATAVEKKVLVLAESLWYPSKWSSRRKSFVSASSSSTARSTAPPDVALCPITNRTTTPFSSSSLFSFTPAVKMRRPKIYDLFIYLLILKIPVGIHVALTASRLFLLLKAVLIPTTTNAFFSCLL